MKARYLTFIGIAVLPILLFGFYAAFVTSTAGDWRADLGKFGDSFGAVNALFTGLTFAGLIITILQQREEIALQHKELVESRVQFERSATAQETSARFNALSELLKEYESQIGALEKQISNYKDKKQAAVTAGDRYSNIVAAFRPSPWNSKLDEVREKKAKIIEDLEKFLASRT